MKEKEKGSKKVCVCRSKTSGIKQKNKVYGKLQANGSRWSKGSLAY